MSGCRSMFKPSSSAVDSKEMQLRLDEVEDKLSPVHAAAND